MLTADENDIAVIGVDIPKFEEKYSERKTITVYHIDLICHITKHTWHIEKQYDEFKSLHNTLKLLFPNVPAIPADTFFKLTDFNLLTQRKNELCRFLRTCIQHKDILSSTAFRTFLSIDAHAPDVVGNTHTLAYEYTQLPFGVRDFIYVRDKEIMLMCCSDMNIISRADSFLTNFTFPWESNSDAHVPLSAAFVYKVLYDANNDVCGYKKIWAKSFANQTGVISFDTESEVMCIGLDNGKVCVLQHNTSSNYSEFIQVCEIQTHNDKVMGVVYDNTAKRVYSCSADKTFYCHDVTQTPPQSQLVCSGKCGYTNMQFNKRKGNVYLTNESGMFSIFTVNEGMLPKKVMSLQTSTYSCVRGFDIYYKGGLVFMGMLNGRINVLTMNAPGKEKLTSELTVFDGDMKIRVCKYNEVRNELITGDEDGRVAVWCLRRGEVVYCWTAHEKSAVMQMWWDEEGRMLWTGGKDRKMKLWKLPEKWDSKAVEEFESKEIKNINETIATKRMKDNLRRYEEGDESDSSGDDLCGWDFDE